MTAQDLCNLYAVCFPNERGWSAEEFDQLLQDPSVLIESSEHGFALVRLAGDEAEVLSLGTAPEHRKKGIAGTLFTRLLARARELGARQVFLEVACSNHSALSAYLSWGFAEVGRRKGYYLRRDGSREDALVLRRDV